MNSCKFVEWFRFFFYSFVFFITLALTGAAIFLIFYILPHTPDGDFARVRIGNTNVIAEIVATPAERARGLGGRGSLSNNAGMLFVFPRSGIHTFWMKDMQFPIDIIWIEDNRVVDMTEGAQPFPAGTEDPFLPVYRPDASARMVLEVPAGFAARHNIVIGAPITVSLR